MLRHSIENCCVKLRPGRKGGACVAEAATDANGIFRATSPRRPLFRPYPTSFQARLAVSRTPGQVGVAG
jgi:hypothetical protein